MAIIAGYIAIEKYSTKQKLNMKEILTGCPQHLKYATFIRRVSVLKKISLLDHLINVGNVSVTLNC